MSCLEFKPDLFARAIAKAFAVPHGDAAAGVGALLKPMENESFQHQLGIGQMPGAILFERLEKLRVEPVRSLHRQRLTGQLRRFRRFTLLCHNAPTLCQDHENGKPITMNDCIDFNYTNMLS